jgi:hypothetical protein
VEEIMDEREASECPQHSNSLTSTWRIKVSFVPLSPTVLIVLVIVGYLYMADRPGLSKSSERVVRGCSDVDVNCDVHVDSDVDSGVRSDVDNGSDDDVDSDDNSDIRRIRTH